MGVVLSVRPGRVPRHRRRMDRGTSGGRRGRRSRARRRCSGRSRAARAAGAWRGSSRATGSGERAKQVTRLSEASPTSAARGRSRSGPPADGASCSRSAPRARSTRATGNFPAARSSPARRPRAALARELHEELGIDVDARLPLDHARLRLRARHGAAALLPRHALAGELHGREDQAFAWQRVDALERRAAAAGERSRCCGRSRCPRSTASAMPARSGEDAFLAALDRALAGGLRLVQLREKTLVPRSLRRARADAAARLVRTRGGDPCWSTATNRWRARPVPTACISPRPRSAPPPRGPSSRTSARRATPSASSTQRRGARARLRGPRAGPRHAEPSTRDAAGLGAVRADRARCVDPGVCDRRPGVDRPG